MAAHPYHRRVFAQLPFDASRVHQAPRAYELLRFSALLWSGQDDEGWCVYRQDAHSGEVLRIDFLPPW